MTVTIPRIVSVLFVEDVPEMRALLEHVLQGIEGIKISGMAQNTFEARLELSRRRPDLVLLDEVLPGESSLDLLAEIRVRRIPVILITSMEKPLPGLPLPPGALERISKPGWESVEEDRQRIKKAIFNQMKQSEA
jgi:chemotaxis response regulator CheB